MALLLRAAMAKLFCAAPERGVVHEFLTGDEQQKTRHVGGFFGRPDSAQGLDAEAFVTLLELRDATATVHKRLGAAGPCRMGRRVDVEVHGVTLFAPGGAGGVFGTIG